MNYKKIILLLTISVFILQNNTVFADDNVYSQSLNLGGNEKGYSVLESNNNIYFDTKKKDNKKEDEEKSNNSVFGGTYNYIPPYPNYYGYGYPYMYGRPISYPLYTYPLSPPPLNPNNRPPVVKPQTGGGMQVYTNTFGHGYNFGGSGTWVNTTPAPGRPMGARPGAAPAPPPANIPGKK